MISVSLFLSLSLLLQKSFFIRCLNVLKTGDVEEWVREMFLSSAHLCSIKSSRVFLKWFDVAAYLKFWSAYAQRDQPEEILVPISKVRFPVSCFQYSVYVYY